MIRLTIARHGNTFLPEETPRRIGARTDLPLVASGIAQAEALARHFRSRDIAFQTIFCGPLRRTRQTAAIIADRLGTPTIRVAEWLGEIDYGPDESQEEAAVRKRVGQEALDRWESEGIEAPGWEVRREWRLAQWQRVLADPPPGHTLFVTSNGAARFALLALRLPRLPPLKLATGAYGEIAAEPMGAWSVPRWNITPD